MTLPAYLDTHTAIVGASGAGKTVTGKGMTEQLLHARRHTAIIDPTGAWYGMRSNAAGDGAGFDIPIFGGRHGDVPITPSDGDAVARIVVEQRVSAIVDLSEIREGPGQRRFMAEFTRGLRRKPKGNFHLVIDEADEFCPQTPRDDVGFELLEDMIWIAKRGRLSGFVLTAITQRPADIAKAVLSQMQTLVVHQLIAPTDQAAIDAYLKAHGNKDVRAQVMTSLPGLDRGERWIYAPRLQILERGKSPPLETFDSSRTPAPGEEHVEPRMLSEIDVSAIAAALAKPAPADSRDEFRSDDALHEAQMRIGYLEGDVEKLTADRDKWKAKAERQEEGIQRAVRALGYVSFDELSQRSDDDAMERARPTNPNAKPEAADALITIPASPRRARLASPRPAPEPRSGPVKASVATAELPPVSPHPGALTLAPRHQKILDQAAWAEAFLNRGVVPRDVLAWLCDSHPRTKGFINALGELRTAHLIDYPGAGTVALTGGGYARAAQPAEKPTPAAMQRAVADRLEPRHQEILRILIERYPRAVDRDELAKLLEYHPRTKSFINGLGRMRTLGIIEYPASGEVRAASFLFGASHD